MLTQVAAKLAAKVNHVEMAVFLKAPRVVKTTDVLVTHKISVQKDAIQQNPTHVETRVFLLAKNAPKRTELHVGKRNKRARNDQLK